MKTTPNKLRLLMLSLFVAVSIGVNAQEDAKTKASQEAEDKSATAELILGLPKVSDKNLFIIIETAAKIDGLVYVQFCEAHKLGMFRYNKELFRSSEDIIKAFEKENVIMPMLVKEGTFKGVEEICPTK